MSTSSSSLASSSSVSAEIKRGIHLRRLSQSRHVEGSVDGFRFRVQAYGASLMPVEIFRFLTVPQNPLRGDLTQTFDGVCSSVDLAEYPVGAALPDDNPPYFRLDTLDLVFRSRAEAEQAWLFILEEVTNLVNSLNIQDQLEVEEIAILGSPAPADAPTD